MEDGFGSSFNGYAKIIFICGDSSARLGKAD